MEHADKSSKSATTPLGKILLVVDDEIARRSLELALSTGGYSNDVHH
jgi:hypothetical protein